MFMCCSGYDVEGVSALEGGQACTACCSHDAVMSACNTSRFNFDAKISHQDLVSFYLPSWEAAIKRAHAHSVMCSFNSVNGQPQCSNGLTENEILRSAYGFDGYIVTDCGAVEHLKDDYWVYGPNTTWAQAAAAALNNGTDLECAQHNQGKLFNVMHLYLNQSLKEGLVTAKTWNRALERWFEKLFLLGAFDKTVSYRSLGAQDINTPAAQALALRAARESIVLLQNNATKTMANAVPSPLLPLPKTTKLALIGPLVNASHQMQSDYTGSNNLIAQHTPYLAIAKAVQQHGGSVTSSMGCAVKSEDASQIPAAVATCHAADVCILFIGMDNSIEGEGNDRQDISLPGVQAKLAKAVIAVGKPTAVVLIGGAALAIADIKSTAPSIINAHCESQTPASSGYVFL